MKTQKTTFNIDFRTEFGLAQSCRKCDLGMSAEETFKSALRNLTKLQTKTWECISFIFQMEAITIMRHHWEETNFNFEQSAQTEAA